MTFLHLAASGALLLSVSALAQAPAPTGGTAAERFKTLYTREWKWRQAQQSGLDEDADRSQAVRDRFPKIDAATQEMRAKYWQDVLKELKAIPVAGLSAEEQVDYAIYQHQVESLEAEARFKEYEKPFNSDSSFWAGVSGAGGRPLRSVAEYRGYIRLLDAIPAYFNDQITNMRAGMARGFTVPQVTLKGRDEAIATVANAASAEKTNFYQPFTRIPARFTEAEQAELKAAGLKAINESVIPAYKTLLNFIRNEYVPKATTKLGAFSYPDGPAYYQSKIKEFTTTSLTPDEIHNIGLAEVAKIKAQMLETIKKANFQGDFQAFLKFLRTDPQFYAKTKDELLWRAAWISKRVDGKLSEQFGILPRGRFTIVPVPDDIAPFYTAGRGGAGTYWVNTYDLPSRSLYNLPALTLHESAPGHAMQGSLAAEQKAKPEFRQRVYISAYGEGWGLYTEKLGIPMGIYETPYEHFGMLTYQMWRAARLVIDTGVHAKGWTRDQALAFLRDNTALSEHEVTTEVDRYISWPGQALSYYLGMMQIERSRAEAEKALGDRFDVRAFHDTVLAMGSVTLPQLDLHIKRFIAEGGKGPKAN